MWCRPRRPWPSRARASLRPFHDVLMWRESFAAIFARSRLWGDDDLMTIPLKRTKSSAHSHTVPVSRASRRQAANSKAHTSGAGRDARVHASGASAQRPSAGTRPSHHHISIGRSHHSQDLSPTNAGACMIELAHGARARTKASRLQGRAALASPKAARSALARAGLLGPACELGSCQAVRLHRPPRDLM